MTTIKPQMHLRRGELMEWLEPLGFTKGKIRDFITAGVIPAKFIPHTRRKRARKKDLSRSSNPLPRGAVKGAKGTTTSAKLIPGRAFFVAGEVAKALGITL
jgi:hypothetical protein